MRRPCSRPPFVLLAAAGSIARGRESMTSLACWEFFVFKSVKQNASSNHLKASNGCFQGGKAENLLNFV